MDPSLVGAGSSSSAAVPLQHNGSVSGSSVSAGLQQSTGAGSSTDRVLSDASADVGKMFVGGLNWLTTSESLKDYFSRFGEVKECVIMKTPMTRKSRGFGFVTFVNPDDVDKVLQVASHEVDGKKIDPKVAVPRKNQNAGTKNSIVTRTKKAFVGGVSSNTTPDDLRSYFSAFGTVEDAMLMVDKATQRHRGFGFITFASEDTVDKVCDIHYHEINGKIVECKKAQPREVLTPAHLRAAGRGGFGLGLPFGRPPAAGAYLPFAAYDAGAFGRAGSYPGFGMFPFYPGLPAYLGFYPPLSPGSSPAAAGNSGDFDRRFDYVSKRLEELSLLDQLTNASLAFNATGAMGAGRDRPANFASNTRNPNQSAAAPVNKTLAIRKTSSQAESPGGASVFNPYKATGVGLHMGEPSSSLEGPGVRTGGSAPYLGPAASTGLSGVSAAVPTLNHAGMGAGRNYTANFS